MVTILEVMNLFVRTINIFSAVLCAIFVALSGKNNFNAEGRVGITRRTAERFLN